MPGFSFGLDSEPSHKSRLSGARLFARARSLSSRGTKAPTRTKDGLSLSSLPLRKFMKAIAHPIDHGARGGIALEVVLHQ